MSDTGLAGLTELQRRALGCIASHGKDRPVTGKDVANAIGLKPRSTGKAGADMRSIINALRVKGFPVCATGEGYWWPESREELSAYIASFQGRVDDQQRAVDGLGQGFDKVGSQAGKAAADGALNVTYRWEGRMFMLPKSRAAAWELEHPGFEVID